MFLINYLQVHTPVIIILLSRQFIFCASTTLKVNFNRYQNSSSWLIFSQILTPDQDLRCRGCYLGKISHLLQNLWDTFLGNHQNSFPQNWKYLFSELFLCSTDGGQLSAPVARHDEGVVLREDVAILAVREAEPIGPVQVTVLALLVIVISYRGATGPWPQPQQSHVRKSWK